MTAQKLINRPKFWVVAVTIQQDLIKWGKDGDNKLPLSSIVAARRMYVDLLNTKEHRGDRFYILKVFPNGQMVTIEV